MGLFTKETKTKFRRNEAGDVVAVERSSNKTLWNRFRGKTPAADALEKEYYKKHPEKTKTYKAKTAGKKLVTAFDQMADNYVKNVKNAKKPTKNKNNQPKASHPKYIIRGGKAYPIAGSKKKKTNTTRRTNPYSSYDFTNNFNPFGDLFDNGMTTSKKGKKKNKGFDPIDNSGFYFK